jgi:valyl-tRNA synthetase
MTAGNDQRLGKTKIITNRNFCNKLWNMSRYINGLVDENTSINLETKTLSDNWILSKLQQTQDVIERDLNNFHFTEAYEKLYHFIWNDFADWYIESSKIQPNVPMLKYLLRQSLILTHPFAPFVTEAIWQSIGEDKTLLASKLLDGVISFDENSAKDFSELKNIISESRYLQKILESPNPTLLFTDGDLITKNKELLIKLANLGSVKQVEKGIGIKITNSKINSWLDIPEDKAKDYTKELKGKVSNQEKIVEQLEVKLENKNYIENAPASIVDQTRELLKEATAKLDLYREEIKRFN